MLSTKKGIPIGWTEMLSTKEGIPTHTERMRGKVGEMLAANETLIERIAIFLQQCHVDVVLSSLFKLVTRLSRCQCGERIYEVLSSTQAVMASLDMIVGFDAKRKQSLDFTGEAPRVQAIGPASRAAAKALLRKLRYKDGDEEHVASLTGYTK
ncbi:hypothetical protein CYMTET_4690 [Cymbomonas tetramitiformis]|uniref:Uncharacterized protein n=1 Tax=Cymbomonas tetramitiformis TaxID=36881 RepID=A0AAE0H0V9_9CHLO|nr:hypothetical protein CYMTET_4690 [Cymbomonas tetramitiformis]